VKTTRTVGALGGVALIAGITLFGAAPAHAAPPYVTDDEIGVEGDTYPQGWFTGELSIPAEAGQYESTPVGLSITGKVQLLNGTVTTPASLAAAVDVAIVDSDNDDWTFQIPLFTDGAANTGFTTLRPVLEGEAGLAPAAAWITTGALPGFPAGSTGTLQEFSDALPAGWELLAYGVLVDNGGATTLQFVRFLETSSVFSPEPVLTPSTTKLSIGDFTSKGISFTQSGYQPGEEGLAYIYPPGEQTEESLLAELVAVADENGVASFSFVAPAGSPLGTYTVYTGVQLGQLGEFTFEVTANPLAATGEGVNPWFLGAGILLALGGTGAIIFARRAKKA